MLARVHDLLDRQGSLMSTGDFDGVADLYDIPLSIYADGELLVYRSRLAFIHGLQSMIGQYRSLGMQSVQWRMGAIELVRDRRFRVWVSWDHIFADRIETSAADIIYFCRLGPDHVRIEMVQYQAIAPAVLAAQIRQSARIV